MNVWVALFDDAHVFSRHANAVIERPNVRIATCPMIENSVIRVMNVPGYGRRGAIGLDAVREALARACSALDHEFWPDDISLRDESVIDFGRIHGHNQVTDAYLLALAVRHQGCLATFDQRIALSAVRGASDRNLMML